MRDRRPTLVGVFLALTALLTGPGASASAQGRAAAAPEPVSRSAAPVHSITFAARQCDSYGQVMANLARNDIQESLQDLGKNTVYTSGQPIDPAIEEANDDCRPLNGWKFDIGSGFGKSGDLSTVTNRSNTAGPTRNGVPRLGSDGRPSGGTLDGAVTYTLTDTETTNAGRNALWVQGGLVGDPLMQGAFGKGTYGFAALRCAVDNLNGDNVETVAFPSPAVHEYCFAYYVSPEPGSGSITITKRITGVGAIAQDFDFASDLTYNPSGTFELDPTATQPASQTFLRADSASYGKPYTVTEQVPDGWTLTGLECTAVRPGGGTPTSTWTTDLASANATITLGSQDNVTCTYTDQPPQTAGLTVRKVTTGAWGGPFDFTVHETSGADPDITGTVSTSAVDTSATAVRRETVPAGQYTITEHLPTVAGGRWENTGAYCNSTARPILPRGADPSIDLDLRADTNADCTFTNRWVSDGRITVYLRTLGGTGTGTFNGTYLASPDANTPTQIDADATTKAPGVDELATDRTGVPLTDYTIRSNGPLTTTEGRWEFVSFTCDDGSSAPADTRTLTTHLTAPKPHVTCLAIYRLVPASTLEVLKLADGPADLHPGPVVVEVNCDDGAFGRVVLPAGDKSAQLPEPLRFLDPARCTVTEPDNGADPAAEVTTTGLVTHDDTTDVPAGSPLPLDFTVTTPQQDYRATVHNTYRLPAPPPPTPTPQPTPHPHPHPHPGHLAATGSDHTTALLAAALAVALATAGGVLFLTARHRRS
ncbi:DUF5979 domain-containing protein [Kitasatospora sp. NPDC001540]|uniref:prealbumin-like fold domain-containing protein n=1 Tax=Kitasatospora sp. NPDC001540 TaxID=3364014 RepID=UPI003693F247